MRKLTVLFTFLVFGNILHAQNLIDLRLNSAPLYEQSEYSALQTTLQVSYNISPKKSTLRLKIGLELQHSRSKVHSFSCNCEPIFQNEAFIHQGEVSAFSSKEYTNSMTIGIFSMLAWQANKSEKFRLLPSLALHLNDEILFNYYQDRFWEYDDGSIRDSTKTKRNLEYPGTQLGFYLSPAIQVDYLIIPKWKVRLGINGRLNIYASGEENLHDMQFIIAGTISKSLL